MPALSPGYSRRTELSATQDRCSRRRIFAEPLEPLAGCGLLWVHNCTETSGEPGILMVRNLIHNVGAYQCVHNPGLRRQLFF
jgi:hypothetical protein